MASPNPTPTTPDTPVDTAVPAAENGMGETLARAFDFVWNHPLPFLAIAALIALNYGWKKLTLYFNMRGQAVPPLGFTVRRTLKLMFQEDDTPVFTKPQSLLEKTAGFTWKKFWPLLIVATAVYGVFGDQAPTTIRVVTDNLIFPIGLAWLAGAKHLRTVFRYRHRILMQMFEVAAAECRYPKGAELNPWGYIQISKWTSLYSPDVTAIMFPARYRSEDLKNREAFELNFNGTVSDEHTWTYKWESSNNRVIATPVPFITANAPYPFPDQHPWDEFPVGIAAGGVEAVYKVSTVPHVLVAGSTGSGKAWNTKHRIPVPVTDKHPTGWTTMGDIEVGDTVFDEHGKPCTVTWVSDINHEPDLYEITFSDGTVIEADAEHLWWTETRQARTSRWNARHDRERRPRLSPDRIQALRQAAASAQPDDEITLRDAAAIAGIHPTTTWLIDVAANVGHVGELQLVVDFEYAAQQVVQLQNVTTFDAAETWTALSRYRPTRGKRGDEHWAPIRAYATNRLTQTTEGTRVTAVELRGITGLGNTETIAVLERLGVPGTVERVPVTLHVPAKKVRRKGKWARTYNTGNLLTAIAEAGEQLVNDQRHRTTTGGVRTTREILDTLRTAYGHANHAVPVAQPLDLPEAALPIPPYTFGAWLGDGSSRNGDIGGIDWEVAEHITGEGFNDVTWHTPGQSVSLDPNFRIWRSRQLRHALRTAGLLQRTTEEGSRKHIPAIYLRASIAQRRALLAGLLDTDGTVAPQGTVQFTNTNEHLAHQVRELALSLGYRAAINTSIKRSQHGTEVTAWTVSWTCAESPFRLTRKTQAHHQRNKNYSPDRNEFRYITSIRPVAPQPARCIAVNSPSKMFLGGDTMVPTHNSVTQRTMLLHCLQSPMWRIVLIDPKRVELAQFRNHPHVLQVATELDESVALIERVEQEMQARYMKMKEEGVNYFLNMKEPPPALMLMIDEVFALLSPENVKSDEGKERDELHARATVLIGQIARLGRAAGVHMILATQRPDAKVLPGETRANLDVRIAQGRMDTTPSLMTLDSDHATRIPGIKGRAMMRSDKGYTEFQAYFLPNDDLPAVLEMSAALATGRASIDQFILAPNSAEQQARKVKMPALPKLPWSDKVTKWVERRKAIVEANEARAGRFGEDRAELAARRKEAKEAAKKEPKPAAAPRKDPSVDEALAVLGEQTGPGFNIAPNGALKPLDIPPPPDFQPVTPGRQAPLSQPAPGLDGRMPRISDDIEPLYDDLLDDPDAYEALDGPLSPIPAYSEPNTMPTVPSPQRPAEARPEAPVAPTAPPVPPTAPAPPVSTIVDVDDDPFGDRLAASTAPAAPLAPLAPVAPPAPPARPAPPAAPAPPAPPAPAPISVAPTVPPAPRVTPIPDAPQAPPAAQTVAAPAFDPWADIPTPAAVDDPDDITDAPWMPAVPIPPKDPNARSPFAGG